MIYIRTSGQDRTPINVISLHDYRDHDYKGDARVIVAGQKCGQAPQRPEARHRPRQVDHRMDQNQLLGPSAT
jgi:hypothetical protein